MPLGAVVEQSLHVLIQGCGICVHCLVKRLSQESAR